MISNESVDHIVGLLRAEGLEPSAALRKHWRFLEGRTYPDELGIYTVARWLMPLETHLQYTGWRDWPRHSVELGPEIEPPVYAFVIINADRDIVVVPGNTSERWRVNYVGNLVADKSELRSFKALVHNLRTLRLLDDCAELVRKKAAAWVDSLTMEPFA
jgi:hypothetical protein